MSLVFAMALALSLHLPITHAQDCPEPNDSYLSACPIATEAAGVLVGPGDRDAYRFDVLDFGAHVSATLRGAPAGTRLSVLDWSGRPVAERYISGGEPGALDVDPSMPGTYYVVVEAGSIGVGNAAYSLSIDLTYQTTPPRVVLSRELTVDDSAAMETEAATSLINGQYRVQTRRGGNPTGGVAVARVLTLAGGAEVSDFTMIADARIERATGSAALQARIRYRPEAGGGSGYILTIEPFDGRFRLASFEEGRHDPLTDWVEHSAIRTSFDTTRIVVRAEGAAIIVWANGQMLASVVDSRYDRGALTLGAVTYSGPAVTTFDNVIVTTPAR